jgi:hypothetical protein
MKVGNSRSRHTCSIPHPNQLKTGFKRHFSSKIFLQQFPRSEPTTYPRWMRQRRIPKPVVDCSHLEMTLIYLRELVSAFSTFSKIRFI